MASRNHQFGIEINADVKGQESVGAFADRLDDVAKVLGGELKTRAQQAAAELRELAAQGAAIGTFNKLKQEANETAHALKVAEGEAASFSRQIAASGPPTAQEAAALQKLQDAASAVSAKLAQQKQALATSTAELQKLGIASDSTQAAQQRLAARTMAVRDSVKDLVPAYQAAEAGADRFGAATSGLAGMLGRMAPLMAAAFSGQHFIDTITSAEALSRSYEQVFGSTVKARAEMEFIKATANRLGLETLELARSYQSLSSTAPRSRNARSLSRWPKRKRP